LPTGIFGEGDRLSFAVSRGESRPEPMQPVFRERTESLVGSGAAGAGRETGLVECFRPVGEAGERVVIVEDQVSAARHGVGFPCVGGLVEELADPGDRRFGFVRVDG